MANSGMKRTRFPNVNSRRQAFTSESRPEMILLRYGFCGVGRNRSQRLFGQEQSNRMVAVLYRSIDIAGTGDNCSTSWHSARHRKVLLVTCAPTTLGEAKYFCHDWCWTGGEGSDGCSQFTLIIARLHRSIQAYWIRCYLFCANRSGIRERLTKWWAESFKGRFATLAKLWLS